MTAGWAPAAPTGAQRTKGYSRWKGERTAQASRWWVIARGNLALGLSNKWVKIALAASLIPGIILAGLTYFFLPLSAIALSTVMNFTLYFAFLVSALIGARLISEDRKQGAFVAHFSRPVTRLDYLLGKFVALAIPVFVVCVSAPLFGIVADMAVDSETVLERVQRETGTDPSAFDQAGFLRQASYWGALGAVFWFGLIAAVSTAGIVLGVSALTTRSRIAGVSWFAIVALGQAAAGILSTATRKEWPWLLSWIDNLGDSGALLLGLRDVPEIDLDIEFTLVARIAVLLGASILGLIVVDHQLRRAEGGAR